MRNQVERTATARTAPHQQEGESVAAASTRLEAWGYSALLAAVALVSRLPQLRSPNLLLDGDECILGLMAKHLASGREFPIFFYGQNYGFSSIEAVAGALGFAIAKSGAVPLKLAMLGLWALGVVLFFLAASRLLGSRRGCCTALLLVLMPAWAVSSMKAWGGYITAFSASAAVVYVLLHGDGKRTALRWLGVGVLSGVIFLAQPIWLPGILPILLFFLVSDRKVRHACVALLGAGLVVLVVKAAAAHQFHGAWGAPDVGNHDLVGSLPRVARQVYVALTGSYYLTSPITPGRFTTAATYGWLGALIAVAALQIDRLARRRYLLWSHLLFLSVLGTLAAPWMLLVARDARYLLPLAGFLVLLTGVEASDLLDRGLVSARTVSAVVVLVCALGALSMTEFRDYEYMWWKNAPHTSSEGRRLRQVVNYLKDKGVTHAFSLHGLLQWQIMFYSDETIVARCTGEVDRYPPYVAAMDRALERGEAVAIVGYVGAMGGLEAMIPDPAALFTVDDRYAVYAGADRGLLRRMKFDVPD